MKARFATLALFALVFVGCGSTTPKTEEDRVAMDAECNAAIARMKQNDAGLKGWFENAAGYAVYPSVGKGGIGVGGAYGRGQVYRGGSLTGYSSLSQATIGFQLGGQSYIEVIFFENEAALTDFMRGNYELGAQASAVAATAGASTSADYSGGVAIFTMARGGLMYEATVGGQKFSYEAR